MPEQSLAGVKLLIPRPEPAATSTALLVKSHGGDAVVFPVIDITEPASFRELDHAIQDLSVTDILVFVSVHAVNGFMRRLQYHAMVLPKTVNIAAVGPKTKAACEIHGMMVSWMPRDHFHSEGLLQSMNEIALDNKRIAILRGPDGREYLFDELRARGAKVEYVTCYQRGPTSKPICSVLEIWRSGEINCVLITSKSILDALQNALGHENADILRKTSVLTISGRLADCCKRAGIKTVYRADNMEDSSILSALKRILD